MVTNFKVNAIITRRQIIKFILFGSEMSIIVVEIDSRKDGEKIAFDQAVVAQTEHAKQFWKTLILHPHMESRLYSKEITQVLKTNTLKETSNFYSFIFHYENIVIIIFVFNFLFRY